MLLSLVPISFISLSIYLNHFSITIQYTIFKFTLYDCAIIFDSSTEACKLIVQKITFFNLSICYNLNTFTIHKTTFTFTEESPVSNDLNIICFLRAIWSVPVWYDFIKIKIWLACSYLNISFYFSLLIFIQI